MNGPQPYTIRGHIARTHFYNYFIPKVLSLDNELRYHAEDIHVLQRWLANYRVI